MADGGAGPELLEQPAVRVSGIAGDTLAEISPIPFDVRTLKAHIELQAGCPAGLQRLVELGGTRIYADDEQLSQESLQLLLVVDETPLFTWDITGNPCKESLSGEGSVVSAGRLKTDYVNVLTREPIRHGRHYFRFVMHAIGDEQWCGVARDPSQAGSFYSGRELNAWTYYTGRMGDTTRSIIDGLGALHAQGRAVTEFKKLKPAGDVIGMLVDLRLGAVAFDLNGELQGACSVPQGPLWVITHVDESGDRVELQKPHLGEAPPANLGALNGALLDVSSGRRCNYGFLGMWSDSEESEQEPSDFEREPSPAPGCFISSGSDDENVGGVPLVFRRRRR